MDLQSGIIILIVFVCLLAIWLVFYFIPVGLWFSALVSGVRISLLQLILMRWRKVPPSTIVSSMIEGTKAGLHLDPNELEAHYLAGGNVTNVVHALVSAQKANIMLDFKMATAIDLAGRDVFEAVQMSVNPKVINTPPVAAVAKDGIQLIAKARVTVRANIKQLSKKEKAALQQKIAREQRLDVAIDELRKLTRGNKEGNTFTAKTSNLRLPVVGGGVKRYKGNMAEIAGPKGAQVISIYEGKVVEVKRNRITNKYDVYIAHGEYISSYANLNSVTVGKDDKVARNQQIGTIGSGVDVMTMQPEYKMVFGIYGPSPKVQMRASDCFKK